MGAKVKRGSYSAWEDSLVQIRAYECESEVPRTTCSFNNPLIGPIRLNSYDLLQQRKIQSRISKGKRHMGQSLGKPSVREIVRF